MSKFNINEIFTAHFSTSNEAFEITKHLRRKLGFESNNEVARLAIGISLGQNNYPNDSIQGSNGIIRGETLFDKSDYPLWVGLLFTNYFQYHDYNNDLISLSLLQTLTKIHWHNGIKILNSLYEDCEGDKTHFIEKLINTYSNLPNESVLSLSVQSKFDNVYESHIHIAIELGKFFNKLNGSKENFIHYLNGVGYAPHIAIMGQAGSGKTRMMLKIIDQIKKQASIPFILIDLGKGDLAQNTNLIHILNAEVISVPEKPLPLDMFYVDNLDDNNKTTSALENFRDAFSQISSANIGPKQSDNIIQALLPLFKSKRKISLVDIKNALDNFYQENELAKDSVIATINSLNLRELFTPIMSPNEFFSKSWLITFANARTEAKTFSVCLLLSALDYFLKELTEASIDSEGYRSLRLVVAIDEARELLAMNHMALANNVRLHRSKGLSIMLVSQSPDDYDGKKDDYLENIGLPICLKTNARSTKTLKNMFKGDINFSMLKPNTCYTLDVTQGKPVLIDMDFDN